MKQRHTFEQRRSLRVPVEGVAVVDTDNGHSYRYGLADVSLGGVCVRGQPLLEVGAWINGDLKVPGLPPIAIHGRVVRRSDGEQRLAVQFDELEGDAAELIQDVANRALERAPAAAVLVVHRNPETRNNLARELRALGLRVLIASTPLEVLTWLASPETPIASLVAEMSVGIVPTHELLRYVQETHPNVARYVIADDQTAARAADEVTAGVATGVLKVPWPRELLANLAPPAGQASVH